MILSSSFFGLPIPLKYLCTTTRHDEDMVRKRPGQILDYVGDVRRGNGGGERDSCKSPDIHSRPPAVARVSPSSVPPAHSPSEELSPGTAPGSTSSPHHFLKSVCSPPSSSTEGARTKQHQRRNREYRTSFWSFPEDGGCPATTTIVAPTTNTCSSSASFLSSADSVADVGNEGSSSSSSSGRGGGGDSLRRSATIRRLRRSNSDDGYPTATAGSVSSSNDAKVRPK